MHDRKLNLLDRFWEIEKSSMNGISSTSGADRLRKLYRMQCWPSEEYEMSVAEAVAASDRFIKEGSFLWGHASAQAEIMQARQFVVSMSQDTPPAMPASATCWLQSMFMEIKWFVRLELGLKEEDAKAEEDEKVKILWGSDALHHKWALLMDKGDKALIKEWREVGLYRHLLNKDEQDEMDKRLAKLYGSSRMATPATSSASSGASVRPAPAPKAKAKGKGQSKGKGGC